MLPYIWEYHFDLSWCVLGSSDVPEGQQRSLTWLQCWIQLTETTTLLSTRTRGTGGRESKSCSLLSKKNQLKLTQEKKLLEAKRTTTELLRQKIWTQARVRDVINRGYVTGLNCPSKTADRRTVHAYQYYERC